MMHERKSSFGLRIKKQLMLEVLEYRVYTNGSPLYDGNVTST